MTPSQIIQSVSVPDDMNAAQDRAFNFLLCFVGNLKDKEDLRKFLRFVTGSSVNIGKAIAVSFDNAMGIYRRPVAHMIDMIVAHVRVKSKKVALSSVEFV